MNIENYEYLAREVNTVAIDQRISDGYINATSLAKASGKKVNDYLRLDVTKEFLSELERSTGYPVDVLVSKVVTGRNETRGTWVHPQVAINLAQWLSPVFAVQVTEWIFGWINSDHKYYARYIELMSIKNEKIEKASGYGRVLNNWKHEKREIEKEEEFLLSKIQPDLFRIH